MPLVSIVIPTTRSHLLNYSLKSALNQDCDDHEIIVLDNWSANAEGIVSQFSDDRIKYVRTPKRLSMPDNWEYGLQHARGEYITYLADDHAIVPLLISTLRREFLLHPEIKVFTWTWAGYCDESWPIADVRRKLSIPNYTGNRVIVKGSDILELLFNGNEPRTAAKIKRFLPRVQHSCFHRDIVFDALSTCGRFFHPSCPDFASGAVLLAFSKEELWIDEPFLISGSTMDSNSASWLGHGDTLARFYSEIDVPLFENVPLKSRRLTQNSVADTILNVKKALPHELEPYEFNWEGYFKNCYWEILLLKKNGIDVSDELNEFAEVLSKQSVDLQERLNAVLPTLHSELSGSRRGFVRSMIDSLPILQRLEEWVRPNRHAWGRGGVIDAEKRGLKDICDCAVYLGERLSRSEKA